MTRETAQPETTQPETTDRRLLPETEWSARDPEFDPSAVFADPVEYLRSLGLESDLVVASHSLAPAA